MKKTGMTAIALTLMFSAQAQGVTTAYCGNIERESALLGNASACYEENNTLQEYFAALSYARMFLDPQAESCRALLKKEKKAAMSFAEYDFDPSKQSAQKYCRQTQEKRADALAKVNELMEAAIVWMAKEQAAQEGKTPAELEAALREEMRKENEKIAPLLKKVK